MLQLVAKESGAGKPSRKRKNDITVPRVSTDEGKAWIDKYKPKSSKELVLHHSKISSIRDWVKRATSHHAENCNRPGMQTMMIVLINTISRTTSLIQTIAQWH